MGTDGHPALLGSSWQEEDSSWRRRGGLSEGAPCSGTGGEALELEGVTPSSSAMRCIEYSRTEGARGEYAEHTDLSFITVAPRGARDALRVRDMSSLEEIEVERAMGRDTLLVFCGDLMARLTDNHFPAAMHRPEGAWEGGAKDGNAAPDLRLALPFFLRGRSDAILDPRSVGRSGEAAGGPVPVWALEDNVGKSREKFPWKKQPYYSAFGFSA